MAAGEATVTISAPPRRVYDVVSDVTRTGEWSPECVSVEWLDGATAAVPGARFRGHNKLGAREWDMEAVVDDADPGRAFSFHTVRGDSVRTRWGYRLAPTADGTQLTEWYERVAQIPLLMRIAERLMMGGRQKHNDANIAASLARIKTIAEAPA